jgi:UPF0716 protein FxsA
MMSSVRRILLVSFLALPLLEIVVLIKVGQAIGLWPTLGLLFLAAFLGMFIIRQQGLSMVGRMFDTMSKGRFAVSSIVDSYARIAAGCLLIVPGFITDALGIALLVPPLRSLMLGAILPGFARQRRAVDPKAAPADRQQTGRPVVIEGTYQRLDDDRDGNR